MENIKDKVEELNKEFSKYAHTIVKLLSESLNEGEYFVFSKDKEEGIVYSRERLKLSGHDHYENQYTNMLDTLENTEIFVYKKK